MARLPGVPKVRCGDALKELLCEETELRRKTYVECVNERLSDDFHMVGVAAFRLGDVIHSLYVIEVFAEMEVLAQKYSQRPRCSHEGKFI